MLPAILSHPSSSSSIPNINHPSPSWQQPRYIPPFPDKPRYDQPNPSPPSPPLAEQRSESNLYNQVQSFPPNTLTDHSYQPARSGEAQHQRLSEDNSYPQRAPSRPSSDPGAASAQFGTPESPPARLQPIHEVPRSSNNYSALSAPAQQESFHYTTSSSTTAQPASQYPSFDRFQQQTSPTTAPASYHPSFDRLLTSNSSTRSSHFHPFDRSFSLSSHSQQQQHDRRMSEPTLHAQQSSYLSSSSYGTTGGAPMLGYTTTTTSTGYPSSFPLHRVDPPRSLSLSGLAAYEPHNSWTPKREAPSDDQEREGLSSLVMSPISDESPRHPSLQSSSYASHSPTVATIPGHVAIHDHDSPQEDDPAPQVAPQSKTYSFVSLPGNAVRKRPRRRYDEIERLYACSWPNCQKSYGTLNHLNAHVSMQKHGPKRSPTEFKELRKMWRKQKKEDPNKPLTAPIPPRRTEDPTPPPQPATPTTPGIEGEVHHSAHPDEASSYWQPTSDRPSLNYPVPQPRMLASPPLGGRAQATLLTPLHLRTGESTVGSGLTLPRLHETVQESRTGYDPYHRRENDQYD